MLGAAVAGAIAGAGALWVFQGNLNASIREPPIQAADYQGLAAKLSEHAEGRHELEAEMERMGRALSQLKSEMKALRKELRRIALAPIESAPAETWAEGVEDPPWTEELSDFETTEERSAKERELENLARLERNDAVHEQEPVDPQWAQQTTQKITKAFRQAELPASQITNIDCRATRCRVVVFHAHGAAYQAFQKALSMPSGMSSLLPRAAFSHFELADGGMETVMFLYQHSLRSAD